MAATRVCMTPRQLREFLMVEPVLQEIFLYLASQWPSADMDVTCIYRTPEEEIAAGGQSGIHKEGPPFRAIDVRVSGLATNPQAAADALGGIVNARYIYDPARPEKLVAFTAPHGTGPHVHLQCHSATKLRPPQTKDV